MKLIVRTNETFVPYSWCESNWVTNTDYEWVWVDGTNIIAEDSHTMFVIKADIDIERSGPETAFPGDAVEFVIVIHNDGNVPSYDVRVTDPYPGVQWYIEVLDMSEFQAFHACMTILACWECDRFTNWAKMRAQYNGLVVIDPYRHEIAILLLETPDPNG